MNRAQLIGRLGAEPRGGVVNGHCFSNISIGTKEDYTDRNGCLVRRTTWHRVVCWGRTAEFVNAYLTTGRLVLVEGRMRHRQYTDRHGIERTVTEIVATHVRALDPRPAHDPQPTTTPPQGNAHDFANPQPIYQ